MARPRTRKPPAAPKLAAAPEPEFEPSADAVRAYEHAHTRAESIRAAWEKEGSPLLTEGSMGQLVEHPLVKMLREAEAHADRLRKGVQKRHAGPAPKAVVTARIGPSPATKLRAVK